MRKINRIRIFLNNNEKSLNIVKKLEKELIKKRFKLVEEDYELAIAVGGDGSFLRMVKQTNFNSDVLYVGINAGTLGFAQEVKIENIEDFIEELNKNDYKTESIGIQETKVITSDNTSRFFSLNEIVVRDKELNTAIINIKIDDIILEKFIGDGLLISTSFGSTAYNLSFGGSIVYNTLHTLQITPIAPLNNKSYRNLLNSFIIPENKIIKLQFAKNKTDIIITIDGENHIYRDVMEIETCVKDKRITCLRRNDYEFINKINEKFLN